MVNSMKYFIYYVLTATINIIIAVVFKSRIVLSKLSFVPVFLLLLSIFEAIYFYNNSERTDSDTNYSLNSYRLKNEEWSIFTEYMMISFLLSIPLYIPFIIFFDWLKLISILIFLLCFILGSAVFKLRFRKQLNANKSKEKEELEKQKAKEELGYL